MIQTGCCVVMFGPPGMAFGSAAGGRRAVMQLCSDQSRQACSPCSAMSADQVWLGGCADLGFGNTWRTLHQPEALVRDIQDSQVGDDAVDDALAGEWQRAFPDDLEVSVLGDVLHQDDDPSRAMDEVHGPAHALDHLAGDRPVGEVARGGDLHGAKNRGVDPAGADHPEARGRVEVAGTCQHGHGLLAGVDQIRVLVPVERVWAGAQDAVLRLKGQLDVGVKEAGDQGRQADAEVDVVPAIQLAGSPGGHLLSVQCHRHSAAFASRCGRVVSRSIPLSTACAGDNATTRSMYTPGRWMASGSSSPGSTRCSTSAMAILADMAQTGLKLRAALRKTRFPCRSPFQARTKAKSAGSDRSRR